MSAEDEFDAFWAASWRKVGKLAALRAYIKADALIADVDTAVALFGYGALGMPE
jgi:hypothetical protein